MSALAFFPWLEVRDAVDVGPIHLLNYRRGASPGGEAQRILDIVTEPYVATKGHPIERATLFRYDGKDLLASLEDPEIQDAFELAGLVTTAGLGARSFFRTEYWSRDHFQFTIQAFGQPGHGAFIQIRRLDGHTGVRVVQDALVVARPVHAIGTSPVRIDTTVLAALIAAREDDEWPRFREASQTFNLASTDSSDVPIELALTLVNGALEQVLGADAGKENELADRFDALFRPAERIGLTDCARLSSPTLGKFARTRSVAEAWLRDLFRLRGDLAHGRLSVRYPSVWDVREHLLLAGFIFPLLLKLALAERGHYEMTEKDAGLVDAFEELCCADHFTDLTESDDDGRPGDAWHSAIMSARLRRIIERHIPPEDWFDPGSGTNGG